MEHEDSSPGSRIPPSPSAPLPDEPLVASGSSEHRITERRATCRPTIKGGKPSRELREQYKRLLNTLCDAGLAHWSFDSARQPGWCSPGFLEMIGKPAAVSGSECEIAPRSVWRRIHAGDRDSLKRLIRQSVRGDGAFSMECRFAGLDGTLRWALLRGDFAAAARGGAGRLAGTSMDVSERHELQDQMRYLASHDPLTGLDNRAKFSRDLSIALARATQRGIAILLIDLDRFKLINDALGHYAGDRLLQEMARRLRTAVPEGASIARMGGDEFVVLLENPSDLGALPQIARRILQALVIEYPLEGQLLNITASIGISLSPRDGHDEHALVRRADIAMYRAKAAGKNTFAIYSPQMDAGSVARLSLESDLRRAIDRNELTLCYQPKFGLPDARITGSEVLVRWNHEELGLLNPEDFIPIAEESGLIVPLTRWILRKACSQNHEWARLASLRLAVNLSARQFADGSLLDDVRSVLAETGMQPGLLELEITESMMMSDTRHTHQMLAGLKALGVHIALDDFGVAYSSLSHLKRFPIDIIKIDRSFISGIPDSTIDEAIIMAIITLSHELNISVVAEGVENAAQLQFLRRRQCNEIQGYLFSAPLDVNEFTALLQGNQQTEMMD